MNPPPAGDGVFRAYYVWPRFPSVSISKGACALDCAHCGGKYLQFMEQPDGPDEMARDLLERFDGGDIDGALVSGGCDREGRLLGLDRYLTALSRLTERGMIIKLHTGFVDIALARKISDAGVQIASQEMAGDPSSVQEVFGLDCGLDPFMETFRALRDADIPHICPHIVVGLHGGEIRGEARALEELARILTPSTLAIIIFRPTSGTRFEGNPPPRPEDVRRFVELARETFPTTKLVLGSLRPRSSSPGRSDREVRLDMERAAMSGGVDGMELPSQALLREVRDAGMKIMKVNAFGVLPREYEQRVRTQWS